MLNLYSNLSSSEKERKLNELTCIYEQLAAGSARASVSDETVGQVTYVKADMDRLLRLILQLQVDLGFAEWRCGVPIRFGGL